MTIKIDFDNDGEVDCEIPIESVKKLTLLAKAALVSLVSSIAALAGIVIL